MRIRAANKNKVPNPSAIISEAYVVWFSFLPYFSYSIVSGSVVVTAWRKERHHGSKDYLISFVLPTPVTHER